ncbi:helix-turn-helix transcriptional regulator [Streptomyces sp. NPDC053048]|uniref:helix-turn-helix transcriptional regulator n=1 Tax=Streptomyces sp. NPDC053048 TaxID=3365694 RepID=UPI0037CEF464
MTTMVMESTAAAYAAARPDEVRRQELAAFLRSRRERISPEQAGLPRGPRRRTPGLRREEVAQLAAVGVTWYTWLEQARDIQVSAQVLDSVSRALMLDRGERAHLFALANSVDPLPGTECTGVTHAMRLMLEGLEPYPACIQNARYDILAYNNAYRFLMSDLDAVPPENRNCLWLYFTDPDWRAGMADREDSTRAMAAKFRASMADHLAEPAWKCLLKRLQDASPEFRRLWERHEVVQPSVYRTRLLRQPQVGLLRLDYTSLWTGPTRGARVLTFTPADEETHDKLLRLRALTSAGDRRLGEGGPSADRPFARMRDN